MHAPAYVYLYLTDVICFLADSLVGYLWLEEVLCGSREEVAVCFILAAAFWVK